jgi:TrmH family RNA methyltransferase
MIKTYTRSADYSYTAGFYPTFELLKYRASSLKCIYVTEDVLQTEGFQKISQLVSEEQIIVSEKVFNKLKEKDNDHIIGVFYKFEDELVGQEPHVVLVNPSDQGNLGNIMRSMLAFGYKDLAIITPGADNFSPKTVRASMGSIFAIRIQHFTSFEEYIEKYPRLYFPFMLQSAKGLMEISKPKEKYSLVFGNEATGLPDSFENGHAVKIEQSKDVDSLNLATAAVVAMYYFKNIQ